MSFWSGLSSDSSMLRAAHFALAGKLHGQQPAAGRAFDLDAVELGLHRLHLRFEFGGLFHQAEKISHRLVTCVYRLSSVIGRRRHVAAAVVRTRNLVGVCRSARRRGGRTSTISAPGKRASTACTSGSPRTPSFSSALRVCACA